jgi:hypothetical protein
MIYDPTPANDSEEETKPVTTPKRSKRLAASPALSAALTTPSPAKRARSNTSTSKVAIKEEEEVVVVNARASSSKKVKIIEEDQEEEEKKATPKSKSPRKPVFKVALDKAHPAPPRWKEAFDIIKKQREGRFDLALLYNDLQLTLISQVLLLLLM